MSTRARSPLKRNAEQKFPIRLRTKASDEDRILDADAIHEWLLRELGWGNYAWTGDNQPGHYANAFYLPNMDVARRLVETFDLELLHLEDMKLI
ncbi:hypothetical protein [uncultured Roseobacter sp.]|uniref:hypothetical protein n=1 Tax=uncultured Roseobacter sp. TaxID=114847 RepID=UPI00261EDE81|nr:hypothetical protein [uncultured Roseobacter sp.]